MKRAILAFALCAAAVTGVAAQPRKYGVTATPEKGVDFAKFKSYTWMTGQPSADKKIDSLIVAAIDREMAGLGMTKVASSGMPDVVVTYYSQRRTDVDLKAKADSKGAQPEYTVGTLLVALLDPSNRRQRLLGLRMDQPIDAASAADLQSTIDGAVKALFEQYPTRTRK